MAEKKADRVLLDEILNELDITFEDEATRNKIKDIMHRGKGRLEKLSGTPIDFTQDMTARELIFAYCRYGRSNAIEQFEHDFSCQLTAFALEAAVSGMQEGEAADESEV